MSTSEQVAREILRLDPGSLHGFGAAQAVAASRRLAAVSFEGLAIQAPEEIDLARWSSFPVVVASGKTGLRAWEVDFDSNAVFVAVALESGEIFMDSAHPAPEAPVLESEPKPPRPTRVNAASRSYGARCFDLRQALDLPWSSAAYAVTLISYDWVSNTVVTRLTDAEETPAPAGNAGKIDLRLPAGEASRAAPFPVRAALEIPITRRQLVPVPAAGDDPRLRAWVPATLAILALDRLRPLRVDLAVPILADGALSAGQIGEGEITIDLFDCLAGRLPAGAHLVYLLAGRQVAGPERIVVT